jgi:hypothetical protein
MPTAKT